jgi:drug/metabolite transporter (DMT)-like permease
MTPPELARRHRGEALAAFAAMGFGSAYVATSLALPMLGPLPVAVWRTGLAAVVLALVAVAQRSRQGRAAAGDSSDSTSTEPPAVTGAPRVAGSSPSLPVSPAASTPARLARLLVIAAFGGPVFLAAMNLAVAHAGATIAAFVAGLYAVLAAVIAPAFLPERLTLRVLGGFLLALVGTALLAELDPAGASAEGLAWGLLAATSFALYLVLARRWSGPLRLDGTTIGFANASLTAVALGAVVVGTAGPAALVPAAPTPGTVTAIAWLAIVAAAGPILTVASVRLIPAARSAAFLLLNPITATVLAAILVGERPSPVQLAGGALVLAGMAVVTLPAGGRGRR